MKVYVPDYYNKFKCIAGACEDTCCAGWDVDVDEDSFTFYKSVDRAIGKRLKSVMLPKAEGEGCSFRLMPDKRCPFLNENNLCDIYIELGEEALCDTCTYFPRFVHDYGAVREIGLAPSCFTAAQLMVGKSKRTELVSYDDKDILLSPHDMEPEVFFMLKDFRGELFSVLWDDRQELHLHSRLKAMLERALEVQADIEEFFDVNVSSGTGNAFEGEDVISLWLEPFEGMELISKAWLELLEANKFFLERFDTDSAKEAVYREFEEVCTFAEGAFKQLLFYYFFRYVLEAVHDGRVLCAVKTGIVAYLSVKRLCVACFASKKGLSEDEMADIFHLYSRQIEHSDINFEHYRHKYDRGEEYSVEVLRRLLEV